MTYLLKNFITNSSGFSPKTWSFYLLACRNLNYSDPEMIKSTISLVKNHFEEFNDLDMISIFYSATKLIRISY